LYSHPDWPQEKSALDLRSELRECIVSKLAGILCNTFNPFGLGKDCLKCQTFTLTNVYGRFIGLTLLQKVNFFVLEPIRVLVNEKGTRSTDNNSVVSEVKKIFCFGF
jgi:hypothetical protein